MDIFKKKKSKIPKEDIEHHNKEELTEEQLDDVAGGTLSGAPTTGNKDI